MDKDFIRCYIGDIHLSILATVQRESGKFSEWEFMQGAEFDLKTSYGYQGVFDRDEYLLEAIAKRSVIAETKQPESTKKSILWNDALNIADVLTLLSLARAKYCSTLAVEKHLGKTHGISWGLIIGRDAGNHDIILINNLGRFISEALTFIENNPEWLKESGFTPSVYWYAQAQVSYSTAPSILEIGLYWVSLETLAKTYNDNNRLGITHKKELVKRFISDSGYAGNKWDFLDKAIDDWYEMRNALFHEGNEIFPLGVLSMRRQQLRDFTSLVFVEMLQRQDALRIGEIAKRIRNY